MMSFLSRYRPRYVRSLVYMLQASEYHVREYLAWYHRTSDFAHVERRKRLVFTPKAIALFVFSYVVIVSWVVGLLSYAASTGSDVSIIILACVALLTPFYFPYTLALFVAVGNLLQIPAERALVANARKKLRAHKGIRIAIAGSYGKTSMRELLRTVLADGKKVAAPGGSINTPLGIAQFVEQLAGDEDVLIFELGEYYPGDIRRLCAFVRPDIGIITGINEAHLEKFGTLERTTATIFELAQFVEPSKLYVNAENARAKQAAQSGNVLFSREGTAVWRASEPSTSLAGTSFSLTNSISTFTVSSKLLGLHMVGPLVAAVDIGLSLGLTVAQVERGVAHTKPFEHRLEPKEWQGGVTLLDDSYNGNPDGVAAVIAFLSSLEGRRWYVTPGLVEAGPRVREVHERIGTQLAEAGIEKVVLIRDSVTPHIEAGLKAAGFTGELLWYDDMPKCLAALHAQTVPGDIVLIQNDWPDQYA